MSPESSLADVILFSSAFSMGLVYHLGGGKAIKWVCDIMPLEVNLDTLPPEKVKLSMRFQRVKKKVCRPFEQ